MTNPYGNYDEDGMPIENPKPWDTSSASQTYGNQQGYQQQTYGSAGYNPHVSYFSPMAGISPKSKVIAVLLAFFLGALGVHNFYLGKNGRGMTQLTLWGGSVLAALILEATIILAPLAVMFLMVTSAVGLWAFVEFILLIIGTGSYKYDGEGRILN